MPTKKFSAQVTGTILLASKRKESFVIEDVADEAEALSKLVRQVQKHLPKFNISTEGLKVTLTPINGRRPEKRKKPPYINNNGKHRR